MATIYRVETINHNPALRRGPYRSSLAHFAMVDEESDNMETHPTPYRDVGLAEFWRGLEDSGQAYKYLFGFDSLQQYTNWFKYEKGRRNLIGEAVIGVYEVPDEFYKKGQFQAIAHKEHMVHLHDLCPFTLEIVE